MKTTRGKDKAKNTKEALKPVDDMFILWNYIKEITFLLNHCLLLFDLKYKGESFFFQKGEKEEGTAEKVSMREKKAKKDPNKPKRALSALFVFL